MRKRLFWSVLGILSLFFISACGVAERKEDNEQIALDGAVQNGDNASEESDDSATSDSSKIKEEKGILTIISNGDESVRNDDVELQELLENIVRNECINPMMLSLQLTASEVESYKENGLYIDIEYGNGKDFTIMSGSSQIKIDEVCFLVDEEISKCYIIYYTGKNSKIFSLSQDSRDAIIASME